MDRAAKEALVDELGQVFSEAAVVVVARYQGLRVAQMDALRVSMADADASFKVAKNRLVKIALERAGMSEISDLFTGPTGIAWSGDPVAAAKVMADFAKKNDKLVILGGMMGETVLDESGVKALAEMPSLDELRAKIVGMLNTPATRIAGVLQAPGGQIARVLNAHAQAQTEGAAEAA